MYKLIAGNDKTVTSVYGIRTAAASASYLIPYIKPTSQILDVGCGPGTITADFSLLAHVGKVIGIDDSAGVIGEASAAFLSFGNLSFIVGDAYRLNFPDETFDIVHAHQLLVHLSEPVKALREMMRVVKKGGIVAACDCSTSRVVSWRPDLRVLRGYWDVVIPAMQRWGVNVNAGNQLEGFAHDAGFAKVEFRKGTIQLPGHGERMIGAGAESNLKMGLGTREDMAEWKKAWDEWDAAEDKDWSLETGQILCWKAA